MDLMQDSMGYGITKAFTSTIDLPYQAVMSACKAAIAEIIEAEKAHKYVQENYPLIEEYDFPLSLSLTIAIPVVVTDAILFECFLDGNNSPTLNDISSYCLDWKYPFEAQIDLSPHIPVYVYNAQNIDQLITDADELQKELFSRLPKLYEDRLQSYKKRQNK